MKSIFTKLIVSAAVLGSITGAVAANADTPHHGINARLHHQDVRIDRGVANGSLSPREAARLEHRDARIHRQEHRMRESGGTFTNRERRRLRHELNHSSRAIHRERHDQ